MGSCRKAIFSYNFTDIKKLMILFHLQTQAAERHIPSFLNFWKIKILRNQIFFFKKLHLLHIFCLCCVFLLEKDKKCKNYTHDGLCNSISYKMFVCLYGNWNQDHPERYSNFHGIYIKFQWCEVWPWTCWGLRKSQGHWPRPSPVIESDGKHV